MSDTYKILLCEDDENLGMLLREYLQAKGYEATLCPDGEAGLLAFRSGNYSLCILDVMMPKKDGFTLAREIRANDTETPIIFLTAKNLRDDILEGFKMGADDYITKPFSMEELTLRIEAILRRTSVKRTRDKTNFTIGKYTFDSMKQVLAGPGGSRKLTTKEYGLLALLCKNANDILQRDYALSTIWVEEGQFKARSMDVYIAKLRSFLKDDPDVEIINIHGQGYKLVCPVNEEEE